MPPAARIEDKTSHGTPLIPGFGLGSPNVFIGGKPAWRAGSDFHICPLFFPGSVPHFGGVVQKGSSTVFINGLPAARLGDVVVELGGGTNAITSGATDVLIG